MHIFEERESTIQESDKQDFMQLETSSPPLEDEEQVPCLICLDDHPFSNCVVLSCGHSYCRTCLQQFIFEFAQSGKVTDLRCPDPSCESENWKRETVESIFSVDAATFEMPDGRKLTGKEVQERFVRFKMMAESQLERAMFPCRNHSCDGVLIRDDVIQRAGGEEDEVEKVELFVLCRLCSTSHCGICLYIHQEGESCKMAKKRTSKEDYKRTDKYQRRKEMKIAARAIIPTICTRASLAVKPNVKRCPGCKKYIQKHFGCKHMYCTSCRTSFCWICTTKDDGRPHCRLAKATWPITILFAISFSAVYVPVMFLPWLAFYGTERAVGVPRQNRRHSQIWNQFYFINEWLAAFPY